MKFPCFIYLVFVEVVLVELRLICLGSNVIIGDVKKALVQKTGLEASELKILFRGVEKDDAEQLQAAGVKDASKLVLVEDPNKRVEQVEQPPVVTKEMTKAIAAVIAVTGEVDKLSDRVSFLDCIFWLLLWERKQGFCLS